MMTMPAMASPLTNFIAPSIEPCSLLSSSSSRRLARASTLSISPERRSESIDSCLPGIASSVKRAPTSATRSAPLAMTRNCTRVMIRNTTRPDDEVAAGDHLAEGVDDVPGVPVQEDHARGRHRQREPEQRADQEDAREGGELQRGADVDAHQHEHQADGDVDRDERVDHQPRQRQDHQRDDSDDQRGEHDVARAGQQPARLLVAVLQIALEIHREFPFAPCPAPDAVSCPAPPSRQLPPASPPPASRGSSHVPAGSSLRRAPPGAMFSSR